MDDVVQTVHMLIEWQKNNRKYLHQIWNRFVKNCKDHSTKNVLLGMLVDEETKKHMMNRLEKRKTSYLHNYLKQQFSITLLQYNVPMCGFRFKLHLFLFVLFG